MSAKSRVELHVEAIRQYYGRWRIELNLDKSSFVCFRNASGKGRPGVPGKSRKLKMRIGGVMVPVASELKYLGVRFNKLFKFNGHVSEVLAKGNRVLGMLYPAIGYRSKMSVRTKLILYKQMVRPCLAYGFPCWFSASTTYARRCEVFERKVLRHCLSVKFDRDGKYYSNEVVYGKAGLVPLFEYLAGLWQKRADRLPDHENGLVSCLVRRSAEGRGLENYYVSPLDVLGDRELLVGEAVGSIARFYQSRDGAHHRG